MKRTHILSQVDESIQGKKVVLSGWVKTRRDHGGVIFLDLVDRYGLVQVSSDPSKNKDAFSVADKVRKEYVVQVEGTVSLRPEEMVNEKLNSGKIEVIPDSITILNKSKALPFEIREDTSNVNEEIRLKYRYLDLRTERLQRNVIFRHKFVSFLRNYLTQDDFIEVETPLLTKSTPEGARDFLVPARLSNGDFFAF